MHIGYSFYRMPWKPGEVQQVEMAKGAKISGFELNREQSELHIIVVTPYTPSKKPPQTTRTFCLARAWHIDDLDIGEFNRIEIVGTVPTQYNVKGNHPYDLLELFKD